MCVASDSTTYYGGHLWIAKRGCYYQRTCIISVDYLRVSCIMDSHISLILFLTGTIISSRVDLVTQSISQIPYTIPIQLANQVLKLN